MARKKSAAPASEPEWLAKQRLLVEARFGRPFPELKCPYCINNALDDEFNGQITDDEELEALVRARRQARRDRWVKAMMSPKAR
jgi:hypothetical protein